MHLLQSYDTSHSQVTDTEEIEEQLNDSRIGADDDIEERKPSQVPQGGGHRHVQGGKTRKEETPAVSFITPLTDFLEESESRRERRRRQHEEEGKNATLQWAKNLAQQIDDIKNEKRRKLLKIKMTQLLTECQMEDINDD